jgi:hypothetical protein
MDRSFENCLYFGGELFIPIQEAFDYLVDESVVYELDQLFFYYKGFAWEHSYEEGSDLEPCDCYMKVYLNALSVLNGQTLQNFRQMLHNGGSLCVRWFYPRKGTINGKLELPLKRICYDLGVNININDTNVYVLQSDLDAASKKFGIPKKTIWSISISKNNGKEEKDYIGDSVNAATSISNSPQESVIEFTKSVLIQHPDIKTADLKKHCFDDMNGLNPRDGKIINDLLIKAGAKKSKQGEQAKYIAWESKYPRAQWVRVFNKKNSINNQ